MNIIETTIVICVVLFAFDKLFPFNILREISPIRTNKYWTYIEYNDDIDVEGETMGDEKKIPDYFHICLEKMKRELPDLVVLTPKNINHYVDNFPLKMDCTSPICLKERTNILFSFILEKYGGVCISPGVIVMPEIYKFMYRSYNNEIVTLGDSMKESDMFNTYIIGGKQGTDFMKEYRLTLLTSYAKGNEQNVTDNILSHVMKYYKPSHYHFPNSKDGSENTKGKVINYSEYFGKNKLEDAKYKDLVAITIPFDLLLKNQKLQWVSKIKTKEFLKSETVINDLLKI